MAGVIRKRGIDWTVETAIKFCSWAALDVSGTGFGPAVQDEGLGGRFGPSPASSCLIPTLSGLTTSRHLWLLVSALPSLMLGLRASSYRRLLISYESHGRWRWFLIGPSERDTSR